MIITQHVDHRQQVSQVQWNTTGMYPLAFAVHGDADCHVSWYTKDHPCTAPAPVIPTVSLFDVEFAHDTVLISRHCDHLHTLLQIVQTKAAKYKLCLNHGKCKLVSYSSQAEIKFLDGGKVPKANLVVCLGAVFDSQSRPGNQTYKRIGKCRSSRSFCGFGNIQAFRATENYAIIMPVSSAS